MEVSNNNGINDSFPSINGNNDSVDVSMCDSSDSDIEIIKELKTDLVDHNCDLCCEGNFLVNRLLQFGGILNNELKYACEVCDKAFTKKSSLTNHKKKHLKESTPENLSSRLSSSEISDTLNSSSNKSQLTPFSCDLCSRFYKTQKSLQSHIKQKHCLITHTCKVCNKVFSNFREFKLHCTTHTPSTKRVLFCLKCEKQFVSKELLNVHICSQVT